MSTGGTPLGLSLSSSSSLSSSLSSLSSSSSSSSSSIIPCENNGVHKVYRGTSRQHHGNVSPGISRGLRQRRLERLFPNEEDRELFLDARFPNLIICGKSRSGKSSIHKVVFGKMSPHQTLCLPPTPCPEIHKIRGNELAIFCLIELPGNFLLTDTLSDDLIFGFCNSLIYVLDAQNEACLAEEFSYSRNLLKRAWAVNNVLCVELFLHKMDGDFLAVESVRTDSQRDLHEKLMQYFYEEGLHSFNEDVVPRNLVFYSTSIYDNTIFEACSRVVQRLVPYSTYLEQMLDNLVARCKLDKAFLIDITSKIFVATDTSPFDPFSYEMCSDMIDVVIEICCMYGGEVEQLGAFGGSENRRPTMAEPAPPPAEDKSSSSSPTDDDENDGLMCTIHLHSGRVLYLREINNVLMLTCVLQDENFDRQYLVDFNMRVVKEAILQLINCKQLHELEVADRAAAAASRG